MFRTLIFALAAALLTSASSAQDKKVEEKKTEEKKFEPFLVKAPAKASSGSKAPVDVGVPGEVEVNFLNGSTVRMILKSENLEIATPYGKLAVPSKDIRAIDFGLHFPEGVDVKIRQAVTNLGVDNFRERDQAGKALIELGPYSFPAVFDASRAGDLEVSRRAKELLKQLQKKHPKKDLKTSAEDRVITPSFTIVGRILTTSLKARAELFGEVDLPVARLRALRAFAGAGLDVEVTIDAGKYANAGQWLETDFQTDGRSTVVVTAKGIVDVWPQQGGGQYMVGPNGLQGRGMGMQVMAVPGRKIAGPISGQAYGGMLIGKIGEDGEPFTIGERYEGTPEAQGKLYLHIGPSPWNNQASGNYDVKIARKN